MKWDIKMKGKCNKFFDFLIQEAAIPRIRGTAASISNDKDNNLFNWFSALLNPCADWCATKFAGSYIDSCYNIARTALSIQMDYAYAHSFTRKSLTLTWCGSNINIPFLADLSEFMTIEPHRKINQKCHLAQTLNKAFFHVISGSSPWPLAAVNMFLDLTDK